MLRNCERPRPTRRFHCLSRGVLYLSTIFSKKLRAAEINSNTRCETMPYHWRVLKETNMALESGMTPLCHNGIADQDASSPRQTQIGPGGTARRIQTLLLLTTTSNTKNQSYPSPEMESIQTALHIDAIPLSEGECELPRRGCDDGSAPSTGDPCLSPTGLTTCFSAHRDGGSYWNHYSFVIGWATSAGRLRALQYQLIHPVMGLIWCTCNPSCILGGQPTFWHGLLSLASKRQHDESGKTVQKQDIKFS